MASLTGGGGGTTLVSRLDSLYRRLVLSGFFTKGWGDPEHMRQIFALRRRLTDRQRAVDMVRPAEVPVQVRAEKVDERAGVRRTWASFQSPCVGLLDSDFFPEECRTAHVELVEPLDPARFGGVGGLRPVCLQFAGTGDHYFWRRRTLSAMPMLAEKGLASVIVENPFYGLRKPKAQVRSSLRNVTDMFVMGAALILESLVLHHWCRHERNLGPFVYHGVSMGGHMATLCATVAPEPVGVVPCLAWTSASLTFTEGVLSGAINWPMLESQLRTTRAYRRDILAMCRSERNAFQDGVDLAVILNTRISDNGNGNGDSKKDAGGLSDGEDEDQNWAMKRLTNVYTHLDNILSAIRPLKRRKEISPEEFSDEEDLRQEAFHFMRGIMDECTHLKNYAVPLDPSLCLALVAAMDEYQPREGVRPITEVWPGARIRYLEGDGHISSFLFRQSMFREAIYEVLDMLIDKHHKDKKGQASQKH